jgi:lipopolysaccharide cholinephosphotransferase
MALFLRKYLAVIQDNNSFYELPEEEREKLKQCMLKIYQDVANVCDKYNLCIMLGGGSVLGAVRHQGFIPWDDDLDAMMPRADYNKLLAVIEKELADDYFMYAPHTEMRQSLLCIVMKKNTIMRTLNDDDSVVSGVKIDIFPIEQVPDNVIKKSFIISISFILQLIIKCIEKYKQKNQYLKRIMLRKIKTSCIYYMIMFFGFLFSIVPLKSLYRWHEAVLSSGKGKKFATIAGGRGGYIKETLPNDVFFPVSEGCFESIKVNLPNKPDIYLSNLYGDYMRIPPVEKRERHFYVEFCMDTTDNCGAGEIICSKN